ERAGAVEPAERAVDGGVPHVGETRGAKPAHDVVAVSVALGHHSERGRIERSFEQLASLHCAIDTTTYCALEQVFSARGAREATAERRAPRDRLLRGIALRGHPAAARRQLPRPHLGRSLRLERRGDVRRERALPPPDV